MYISSDQSMYLCTPMAQSLLPSFLERDNVRVIFYKQMFYFLMMGLLMFVRLRCDMKCSILVEGVQRLRYLVLRV